VNDYLKSIPLDKYLHCLGSIVLFFIAHAFTDVWTAAGLATAAHVAKKSYDYSQGRRDWPDLIGDVLAGALGAALALLCALNLSLA
jgi:hypothetical protein